MKKITLLFLAFFSLISCTKKSEIVIAFGSCHDQERINPFWDQIIQEKPDIWIWGGDNIYSDTYDMGVLEKNYEVLKSNPKYQEFQQQIPIIDGTWDDHDYGENDGGKNYSQKWTSQQLFLDFFEVPLNDPRRKQKGVYHLTSIEKEDIKVNIISLDTRYFRSDLVRGINTKKKYVPNEDPEATILGKEQWNWLQTTLENSDATFNILVSSIQFLSNQHGFESWGNFPKELDKLQRMIAYSGAKNVILISGDRHISEFSKLQANNMAYPLIDFTSSGLTHSYENFSGEDNPNRIGSIVSSKSYGVIKINPNSGRVQFEMKGIQNSVLGQLTQDYPVN